MPEVRSVSVPADRARRPRKREPSGAAALMARLGVSRWSRRRVVLGGVVIIAATGIAVNALVLQSARHPAPLFAAVEQARRAAAAAPQKPAAERPPLPPARPPIEQAAAAPTPPAPVPTVAPSPSLPSTAETSSLARLSADAAEKPARGNEKPRVAAPDKPAAQNPAPQTAAKPVAPPKGDPLGEMIRGGIVPPGGIPSEPDPKIMQVQQRLARLGAANVKPDGFMGPATKAAIEKFERDRKWSVTGEISPRLIRELGTVSASRP